MNERIKKVFMDYLGIIGLVVLSIAYIINESVGMQLTNKPIWQIITEGFVIFTMSFAMRSFLIHTGASMGFQSQRWVETAEKHVNIIDTIMPSIDKLNAFLLYDYNRRLKSLRLSKLCGVKYSNLFNEDGDIIQYEHAKPNLEGKNKEQIKYIKRKYRNETKSIERASVVAVPMYNESDLLSRSEPTKDKINVSMRRQVLVVSLIGLLGSAAMIIMSGVFSPSGFNTLAFFSAIAMSIFACAFALLSMWQMYYFVTNDLRTSVIYKTTMLMEFNEWSRLN